jgi:hypothetical protein
MIAARVGYPTTSPLPQNQRLTWIASAKTRIADGERQSARQIDPIAKIRISGLDAKRSRRSPRERLRSATGVGLRHKQRANQTIGEGRRFPRN